MQDPNRRTGGRRRGFTLIELVVVICILGVLASVGIPKYVAMTKEAERASVEGMIAGLSSAISVTSANLLVNRQPVTAHNPFDDLVARPPNYAGAFGDVTLTNCPPGKWAYQMGDGNNGNWPVVCYRPKSTLATAFGWSSAQWVLYEVKTITGGEGATVGLALVEFPPLHVW